MIDWVTFVPYLLICAGVTYAVRATPLILIRRKIRKRFFCSFLYYVPFAVLTVMTIPGVLFSTSSIWSAVAGTVVALILAFFGRSLLLVAASSCGTVFLVELILRLAGL